jgi:hypothetical protein
MAKLSSLVSVSKEIPLRISPPLPSLGVTTAGT